MALNRPFFARSVWMDLGEQLDVSQVVNQGGAILAGQAFNNQLYGTSMAQDSLTAHAGGGITNAIPITAPLARVTTVASAGDSVQLPLALRGMEVIVVNDAAANAMNVFPQATDTINNGAAGAALSVLAANNGAVTTVFPTVFICYSNGAWRTK